MKTKKGKPPKFDILASPKIYSTGFRDTVLLVANQEDISFDPDTNRGILWVSPGKQEGYYLARFLLKIGLEFLLLPSSTIDPYQLEFFGARRFARYGDPGMSWQFAYGVYPNRGDLVTSTRIDEEGPLVTHQLYEFSLGVLPGGDVGFSFIYATHCLAVNLTSPSIQEYVDGFNAVNLFDLRVYRTEFGS